MDQASQGHLDEVHPILQARIEKLINQCAANGLELRVTCGLRTVDEQNALFEQGRSLPGEIVTHASGGYSAHNFGYAVDVVPGLTGFPAFVPDWKRMDPVWVRILTMASGLGLSEGANWRTFKDRPHLYPSELPADPTDAMRYAYDHGGIPDVWKHFEDEYHLGAEEVKT